MRQGLCCGTPLPDARIEQALARGFSTFRANAKTATDLSQAQFFKYPCSPLWVIGVYGHTVQGVQQTIEEVRKFPAGSLIELGNEPNLGDAPAGMPKLSPYDYAAIANDTRAEIDARGMYCYYGAVSNINPDGQKWLKEMLGYAPWIERVSVHRYPYKGDQNPARSPYGSRGAEMTALQTVLNGRRVLVTETGIMCPPVSESEQLAYLRQEVDYWRALPNTDGVIVWVEGGAPQESYGLREGTDGRWRPAGSVFMQGGEGVNCNPYVFNVYDGDPANDEKIPNARVNCRPDGGVETIFLTDGAGNATVYLPPGPPYTIRVTAPGYLEYSWHGLLQQQEQIISLTPAHFDPSSVPLKTLAQFKGAMWTARSGIPYGPRPYDPTNINAMDYYEWYEPAFRTMMVQDYLARGYHHAVTGPMIDPGGYHGKYPTYPGPLTQEWWDAYLDCMQEWWDEGIVPVHFCCPDAWQTDVSKMAELEPFFLQPRAQKLLRVVVPHGWEPATDNPTHVAFVKWGARVFPNALRCIHLTPDHDAPGFGGELPNDQLWANVAPYIHTFLHQSKQYEQGEAGYQEWLKNWNPTVTGSYPDRFQNGYAGWPTFSAWGDRGIQPIPSEYLSYWCFWDNTPESVAQSWGEGAMNVGAEGYLDGGY